MSKEYKEEIKRLRLKIKNLEHENGQLIKENKELFDKYNRSMKAKESSKSDLDQIIARFDSILS